MGGASGSGGAPRAGTGGAFGSTSAGGSSGAQSAAGNAGAAGADVLGGQGGEGGVLEGYSGPLGASGVWTDVTPSGVDLSTLGSCGNYGTESVQADPHQPGTYYTLFMCQGVYRSTDYGQTWSGPINTGQNGESVQDCAGAVRLPPHSASPPPLYVSCIRGAGIGFWRSSDGGADWTRYAVTPAAPHDDFYPPAVDPYDVNHLLMAVHGQDMVVESEDGGETWKAVTLDGGMLHAGTGGINFIDTGTANATRTSWLWLASDTAGNVEGAGGTWRTSNAGELWTKVETNDHPGGMSEIYQPDTSGLVFMAGVYSANGAGVFRSTDYGVSWAHVGQNVGERVIIGTQNELYAMNGAALGPGGIFDPILETSPWPGTGTWDLPGVPAGLTQGPGAAAVGNVKTQGIVIIAAYNAGLWRYVEP
ncbi:MAG TPA: hypothetical protein VGP93_20125 [Polyangiaceae bacterium]|nr:hypothetical protein [Polyangiaceae bacterium]